MDEPNSALRVERSVIAFVIMSNYSWDWVPNAPVNEQKYVGRATFLRKVLFDAAKRGNYLLTQNKNNLG